MIDKEIKRQIIIDHYSTPRNFKEILAENYKVIDLQAKSCVDSFKIYLDIDEEVIKDFKFQGKGCAISTASISILSKMLINQKVEVALEIIENYLKMIQGNEYDEKKLEELVAFDGVKNQIARISCASLGANGLKEELKKYGKTK